jgi:hypothetical protein
MFFCGVETQTAEQRSGPTPKYRFGSQNSVACILPSPVSAHHASTAMSDTMEGTSQAPEICLDGLAADQAPALSAKAAGKRVRTHRARPEREAKQKQRQADRDHAAVQAERLREEHDTARQTQLAAARESAARLRSIAERSSEEVARANQSQGTSRDLAWRVRAKQEAAQADANAQEAEALVDALQAPTKPQQCRCSLSADGSAIWVHQSGARAAKRLERLTRRGVQRRQLELLLLTDSRSFPRHHRNLLNPRRQLPRPRPCRRHLPNRHRQQRPRLEHLRYLPNHSCHLPHSPRRHQCVHSNGSRCSRRRRVQ